MVGSKKPRRLHSKSRSGCAECKRRHIKCDEQKPLCVNCMTSKRSCSYTHLVPSIPNHSFSASIPSPSSSSAAGTQTLVPISGQYFRVEHFTLFNHVVARMDEWLAVTETMRPLSRLYVRMALESPYCMHQLLAIAALHLAHENHESADSYHEMASELQKNGLTLFTNSTVSKQNLLHQWMFSSFVAIQLLAQHVSLCSPRNIETFLDGFTKHIGIYQGAFIVGQTSWDVIESSELKEWFAQIAEDQAIDRLYISRSHECITAMMECSQLDKDAIDACVAASKTLDFVRRRLHSPRSWGPHAVFAWINLITRDYIQLLQNRIPESLVIFAHFAEILHQCRWFWVIGNAGAHLIRGIAATLGPAWAEWLALPIDSIDLETTSSEAYIATPRSSREC